MIVASLTFLLDSPTDTLPANTHRDTFSDRDVDTIQDFSHTFYTVTDFNYTAFFFSLANISMKILSCQSSRSRYLSASFRFFSFSSSPKFFPSIPRDRFISLCLRTIKGRKRKQKKCTYSLLQILYKLKENLVLYKPKENIYTHIFFFLYTH